jgi:hydrogenase maturation factor
VLERTSFLDSDVQSIGGVGNLARMVSAGDSACSGTNPTYKNPPVVFKKDLVFQSFENIMSVMHKVSGSSFGFRALISPVLVQRG